MGFRGLIGPVLAIIIPYLLFEYVRANATLDILYEGPTGHFYIVTTVAFFATLIAGAVGVAGSRSRNIQVSFLALAFLSLAEIFVVHGLATPNLILHQNHLSGIASQLSILMATLWLCFSSLPSDHRLVSGLSQWQRYIVPFWAIGLGVFGIIGMTNPHLADFVPLNRGPVKGAVTVLIILLNGITIYRFYQSYRYSRFPLQNAILYSAAFFIVAQVIIYKGEMWRISWWMYHFMLLLSMLAMLRGLIQQYVASKSLTFALKALFTTDPIERITSSVSPSVKALILATETKDRYTAGHNFRVTMYALKLAEEMQLSPEHLRALAQGAIVHDVGKIHISDNILNKPGRLSEEERLTIQMHPVKGYDMCRNIGFMKDELDIIRSHHEKWDGTGYPDQLKGEDIPLLARIVAVADVYDAVTSNRSYREAWTHERAMKMLNEQKGSHFDPQCVEAWERICERDPQVYQYPATMITEEKSFPGLYPGTTKIS